MPRVNLGKPKRDPRKELIHGVLATYGSSGETERVARILNCSAPTARKRLQDPGSMAITELLRLTRGLGIPLEEVRQAISY